MKKSQDPAWKSLILDHYKQPRAFGKPEIVWFEAQEHNRTCGDHIELYLTAGEPSNLGNFRFTGAGCSLCIASASLMCSLLQNVTPVDTERCLAAFKAVWTDGVAEDASAEWQIFDGLRDYPVRSRCVRLPWQALEKVLAAWMGRAEGSKP